MLVLASVSPRRSALLTQIGMPHRVIPAHIDERRDEGEPIEQCVRRLAGQKALQVSALLGAAGALDQRQSLFEHGDRRVGEAGILVVLHRAGEGAFGLLGTVIDVAGGEVERLGGFAMRGTMHPAVHQAGCGPKLAGIDRHVSGPFLRGPTVEAAPV